MDAFVRLREMLASNKELACKMAELEEKIGKHDDHIRLLFEAIRKLMTPPPSEPEKARRHIGFHKM